VSVTVCEVGPRDGLQNEAVTLPPATRAELCGKLADAGLPRVEAASFVSPARVPQMAGAEEVIDGLPAQPGTTWAGLVLNQRGYERARAAGLDQVHYAVMATESFSQRNSNVSVERAMEDCERMLACARDSGVRIVATVSVAFGCPLEGAVDPGRVAELAARLASLGAAELMLADTIGVAAPSQVAGLVERISDLGVPVGVHLHNTRNTGYANACAALDHGATLLESALGGLGGCPFAPRATGNIATEDLVWLLHREGIETGIDVERLIEVAFWLRDQLGHPLPGLLHTAGPFPPAGKPARLC
jgi:(R)-citramalyl-CoA lyase